MLDGYKRNIDYMRISITDRCDLRCIYCMPEDVPFIPHENILTYEEIIRVCDIAAGLGVRTIKVTGGEPFVRKDCIGFLRKLKAIPKIENVTLTTNGILFSNYIEEIAEIGIDGVNISLDSLDSEVYKSITGKNGVDEVIRSIESAIEYGLRVKINFVPIRGINDKEISRIVRLAEKFPLDVRFIELMPKGAANEFEKLSDSEILSELSKIYTLTPDSKKHGFGPARYYKSDVLKGSIGFISALSGHFCADCNRIRLTSDGFLRLCLYHEDGLDLRKMLREGANNQQIEMSIAEAVYSKPEKHSFVSAPQPGNYGMSRIGG